MDMEANLRIVQKEVNEFWEAKSQSRPDWKRRTEVEDGIVANTHAEAIMWTDDAYH